MGKQGRMKTETRKFLCVEPELKSVKLCSFDHFLFSKTVWKSFPGIHLHTRHHWNYLLLPLLKQDCLIFALPDVLLCCDTHHFHQDFVIVHFQQNILHFQQSNTQQRKLSRYPGSTIIFIYLQLKEYLKCCLWTFPSWSIPSAHQGEGQCGTCHIFGQLAYHYKGWKYFLLQDPQKTMHTHFIEHIALVCDIFLYRNPKHQITDCNDTTWHQIKKSVDVVKTLAHNRTLDNKTMKREWAWVTSLDYIIFGARLHLTFQLTCLIPLLK